MATLFETAMKGYNIADETIKKSQAYAAAREKYGDMAGDPGLFSALQEMDLRERRDDRAAQQQTFNQDMRTRGDTRQQQQHDQTMGKNSDHHREEGVLNLVNGLRQARDAGEDLGEAFDSLVDTLPNLGVDEADIPAMRAELLENPEILDAYHAALTDPNKGGKSASQQNREAKQAAIDAKKLSAVDDVFQRLDILQGVGLEGGDKKEFDAIQESVFGLPTPSKIWQGGFGMLGSMPSSGAADYVVNLEALESDVRALAFETLKGGGQITEKESEFAAQAIARISRASSVEEYRRELNRLRSYMERVEIAAGRRAKGEDVPSVQYTERETTTGEYERADGTGNDEIYVGYVDKETGATFVGTDPTNDDHWKHPDSGKAPTMNDRIREAQERENQ